MKPFSTRSAYLLNLPFLIGLILLLVNDHYLKGAYGNWFTGKLSDFAGILILPLFLKFLFNRSTSFSILLTIIFFAFWKSPFSEFIIAAFNQYGPFPIARVIDYSDLLAFAILPFSYQVLKNIQAFHLQLGFPNQWATRFVFALSLLSFIATSREDDFLPADDSSISSCCFETITLDTIGNGTIFIPNVFTPDGNGINDRFQVIADTGIAQIDTFEVREITLDSIVFFRTNITEINPTTGWDGVVNDTIVPRLYLYRMVISSTDGISSTYSGGLCCLPCVVPTGLARPTLLNQCGFASQFDPLSGFDPNAPIMEALDCFE